MAAASILHVGEDLCFRIPVLKRAGLIVCQTPCSVEGVRSAFESHGHFSALMFHADSEPVPAEVLALARSSPSPLVLFDNPSVDHDEFDFDLIIPTLSPPGLWLQSLHVTMDQSAQLRVQSRALCAESAAVRGESRRLRARALSVLPTPIDVDLAWRLDWPTSQPSWSPADSKKPR